MNKIDPDEGTSAGLLTAGALVSVVSVDYGDTNEANTVSAAVPTHSFCVSKMVRS